LQGKWLAGASFTSIKQLRRHIDDFIQTYNADSKPFKWTKPEVHQHRIKDRRISQL
jgi:phage-related protein